MIRLPQRSVTRFFIPLIDVLILLFCIFLLLPLVEKPDKAGAGPQSSEEERQLEAKAKALSDWLAVRVLEIDPKTGKLYYTQRRGRVEVSSAAKARELIEGDRGRLAEGDRGKPGEQQRELYYLILYPRDRKSPYPTVEQEDNYDRWFKGVALGYDIPGKGPAEGEGGGP
jgi:hypothetical protein